jgi:hypothetical protein
MNERLDDYLRSIATWLIVMAVVIGGSTALVVGGRQAVHFKENP